MVEESTLKQIRNRFRIKFERFWNTFSGEIGHVPNRNAENIFSIECDVESETISLETEDGVAVQFQQVPNRSDNHSRVVDVCIQVKQTFGIANVESNQLEILKSQVSVSYLDTTDTRRGEDVDIQRGLRFEFDHPPQENHPVFHAHYDVRCLDSGFLASEYDTTLSGDERANLDYPRIPSAPMDFLSVIQLILHDHIPDEMTDEGWPRGVPTLIEEFPQFPMSALDLGTGSNGLLVSDWWYVHQSVDSDNTPSRRIPDARLPR
jgi:hypothetical protein